MDLNKETAQAIELSLPPPSPSAPHLDPAPSTQRKWWVKKQQRPEGAGQGWHKGAVACSPPTPVATATSPSGGVSLTLIPGDSLDGCGQRWEGCGGEQGEGFTMAAGLLRAGCHWY